MQSRELASLLGQQLRHHRREQGLSLGDLAARADVSKSILSLIERGEANPSIETLFRITQALQVPLGVLLAEPDEAPSRAIPKESGAPVSGLSGMQTWLIAAESEPRRSELFDIALPAGATQEAAPHGPGVTEVIVCVRGSVTCGPVGDEVQLRPGDAAWFVGDRPHRYSAGKNGARLVNLILTP